MLLAACTTSTMFAALLKCDLQSDTVDKSKKASSIISFLSRVLSTFKYHFLPAVTKGVAHATCLNGNSVKW